MQFEWTDFYMEFATKLLLFKNDRKSLIKEIEAVFASIGKEMPKLEENNELIDIDPFTVFGLFNKKITDINRIAIIRGIAKEFGVKAKAPNNFDGIPILNNFKATFYAFKDKRQEDDINNIWNMFEVALTLADKDTELNRAEFSKWYDIVSKQLCIRWNLTMALFWIRPYCYINLDTTNRNCIANTENMPSDFINDIKLRVKGFPKDTTFPSAKDYLFIKDSCIKILNEGLYEYKNFPELSFYAWNNSEKDNKAKKDSSNRKISKAEFLRWFRPLIKALRDLGGSATPTEVRNKIILNEQLKDEEITATRGKNNVNKLRNELAFARNYLVSAGYIDGSIRGVWKLTESGKSVDMTEELASDIFKSKNKRSSENSALADNDIDTIHYWLYAPGENSSMWDEFYKSGIMAIGWGEIGNLKDFNTKDEMKEKMKEVIDPTFSYKYSAHATWQFANEMNIGDIIFVKKCKDQIIGRGVVISDYEYDDERTDGYFNYRKVKWTHKGTWKHPGQAVMKTLTDITAYTEYVDKLNALFENDNEDDEEVVDYPVYTKENFLDEVFMSEDDYSKLVGILKAKKNIILQGAPGVGKTFVAKRLAYSMMGIKDIERVMMVQFHQSYSYEDFIMGFRPSATGFELKKGSFYNFCKKAEVDSDNDYFFIIDEINRGNLSKIFGELFMLIENDKRGISLQLLYSDEKFAVPKNVYIIGMMNTADRSLVMLDYALRRRFAFFEINPGFETDGFIKYKAEIDNEKFNNLISCIESLNNVISLDESLGDGFCIGHSYFCNLSSDLVDEQKLSGIIEYELIPLIKEYWFDEPLKVKEWSNNLRSAIK